MFRQNLTGTYTAFSGDITNISANNFSRVILMRDNQYVILKNIKAGQQVSVSESMVKCWNRYDEENTVFGTDNENTVTGNLIILKLLNFPAHFLQKQYQILSLYCLS